MALSVGIVGLPNVGKSTLFNALLKRQVAHAANYPFATIEPNVGVVPVPDTRLDKLAEIEKEELKLPELPPKVPATVQFVDIAGLVKGASEGAGLGNKFLTHIREVQVIAHVVRVFEDEDVIKEGSVDVKSDYQTIQTELILADLQTLEKSKGKSQKAKVQVKNQNEIIEKLEESLNKGVAARDVEFTDEEIEIIDQMFLLSAKPEIIVLNISENDYNNEKIKEIISKYADMLGVGKEKIVAISAKIEAELAELNPEEQKEYLKQLGVENSGLEVLIKIAYETLGLISFLTAGEIEVRAWTLRRGDTALRASAVIHTDFEKLFIKAEIVSYDDFIRFKGWKGARELGKARMEGRDYIMQKGDVVEFKIGR
jgi:ribosome-binding ATPase